MSAENAWRKCCAECIHILHEICMATLTDYTDYTESPNFALTDWRDVWGCCKPCSCTARLWIPATRTGKSVQHIWGPWEWKDSEKQGNNPVLKSVNEWDGLVHLSLQAFRSAVFIAELFERQQDKPLMYKVYYWFWAGDVAADPAVP